MSSERFSYVLAFGSSMQPFIQPGETLWYEFTPANLIQVGDVITFEKKKNLLITHRVVKILGDSEKRFFLTKGDNRLMFDPVVVESQYMGKVTRVKNRDITHWTWRSIGCFLARISYGQGLIYHHLANNRLNQIRHRLEKKGLFPKFKASTWFRLLSNPSNLFTLFSFVISSWHMARVVRPLARQGFQAVVGIEDDVQEATRIWNESFPTHPTSAAHLGEKILSHRGNPENFITLKQKGRMLGWALIDMQAHSIYVFALEKNGWDIQADWLLMNAILSRLGSNPAAGLILGPHWIPDNPFGVPVTALFQTAIAFKFQIVKTCIEFQVTRAEYCAPRQNETLKDLNCRFFENEDDMVLKTFLESNRYPQAYEFYKRFKSRHPGKLTGAIVAYFQGQLVGFCRALREDQLRLYEDTGWVWLTANIEYTRGFFFHLVVDEAFRRRGIGAALSAYAFEKLFESGCQEIRLTMVEQNIGPHFYHRVGFKRIGCFPIWRR